MKPPETAPGSAREWLEHARSDIALARLGIGNQNILASQICFHAQQAAEKALKAVLRFHQIEFPLTHDLDVLLELLEQSRIKLPSDVQKSGELTPYAVEARYPGGTNPSENDIHFSVNLAQCVIDWAACCIQYR
jgi:HEPN domain-containing protein